MQQVTGGLSSTQRSLRRLCDETMTTGNMANEIEREQAEHYGAEEDDGADDAEDGR
jgi:hypothetical protein